MLGNNNKYHSSMKNRDIIEDMDGKHYDMNKKDNKITKNIKYIQ